MKVFTYNQYIKCIHTLRLNAILQLAEESENYHLEKTKRKYCYDESIKSILQDKTEVAKFINYFIEPREKIKEEDIIRYTSNYLTKKYKSKKEVFIYKLKNQDTFFLIKHQYTVENRVSYQILNYCLDLMQEWCRNKKIKKNLSYPIIIPIVIYTGDEKWKKSKKLQEKQISYYIVENYKIDLEYNLIDINKLSKQILLEADSIFSYIMLTEKAKNRAELLESLKNIVLIDQKQENLEKLANKVNDLLDDILVEKEQKELLKEIERKVGNKSMSTLFDRLVAEGRRDIQRGKEASKRKIAKNMLNKKIDDKIILEMTEMKEEELEKIKNED